MIMTVYILAPMNRVSGGPELAHQMCYSINKNTSASAKMCYVDCEAPFDRDLCIDVPAPAPYEIYKTEHVISMDEMDKEENVVVFPEGLTLSMPYIKNAKKVMWWMSVDNYIVSTRESNFDYIYDNVELHLYQSYYAYDYVQRKKPGVKGMYLSDYINEAHGKFLYPAELRQDIALYNPVKGYEEVKSFIENESWLKWVPLRGLDVPKMVLIMQSSKIYVDFGNHPGKDRIPREAAVNGCCVITNKKGSAANDKDVPIPEKYKFDDPSKEADKIGALLRSICDDFKTHQDDFGAYREMIHAEKEKFDEDVITFIEYFEKQRM